MRGRKGYRAMPRAMIPMVVVALLMLGLMLTACGPTATQAPTTTPVTQPPRSPTNAAAQLAVTSKELNIWTWGIYAPDFAVEAFEQKYGVKVNVAFYQGNEELWSKVRAGHQGVDIVQPSNHLIKRFANAGLLEPIDISRIPGYSTLFDSLKKQDYNVIGGRLYSVPYTFGYAGIGYRTDLIEEAPTSWGALWNESYAKKVGASKGADDATFATALYLGMDISQLDEDTDAKLTRIKEAMRQQNPLLLKRLDSIKETENLLASGELWITMADDGMIRSMQLKGQPVDVVIPKEGAAAWVDQFAILADAPHKDAAYAWIDHMLSSEQASQMIQKIGYSVVSEAAQEALPADLKTLITISDEQAKLLVPYPTLKPETSQKIVAAYQDVR